MPMIDVFTIGRDAESRTTASGKTVANLSLALNYGQKGNDGKQPTQWFDGALWSPNDALLPKLVKGQKVFATLTDLHLETFTKGDGTESTKLVGRVDGFALKLVGVPPGGERAPAPPPPPKPAPRAPVSNGGFEDMDDDIPF